MVFMKYLITVVIFASLGYFLYPYALSNGEAKGTVETVTVVAPEGKISFDIEMDSITPDEIPSMVKLRQTVDLKNSKGMTLAVKASDEVKVVSYASEIFSVVDVASGQFTGEVPYSNTNFVEVLAKKRHSEFRGESPVAPVRAVEKVPVVAKVAEVTKPVAAEQEEEAEPVKSSELSESELIRVMKKSVKAGMVSEFSVGDVSQWRSTEAEEVEGVSYQAGLATYEKETLFGKQPVVAKCLILNGKPKRWVYAKTGVDVP